MNLVPSFLFLTVKGVINSKELVSSRTKEKKKILIYEE